MLYDFVHGFQPRRFNPNLQYEYEKIIYDEGQEVGEMYFVLEGFIGIGFTMNSNGYGGRQYTLAKRQEGSQLIGDHYVINK